MLKLKLDTILIFSVAMRNTQLSECVILKTLNRIISVRTTAYVLLVHLLIFLVLKRQLTCWSWHESLKSLFV
jgi:hypothetical protein